MHLLITGGAGFIGSRLACLAAERGLRVTVLDNLSTGHREYLDGVPVRFLEGSITDRETLRVALDTVDSVVHLAALGSVPRSIEDPLAAIIRTSPALSCCSKRRAPAALVT